MVPELGWGYCVAIDYDEKAKSEPIRLQGYRQIEENFKFYVAEEYYFFPSFCFSSSSER